MNTTAIGIVGLGRMGGGLAQLALLEGSVSLECRWAASPATSQKAGVVDASTPGACFMIGGDDAAVAVVGPILQALAVPGGYVHAGASGAGHCA